jgi:hypothetical protein
MADSTKTLLHAYYEALYERLTENKDALFSKIETLLNTEIANRNFNDFDDEKLAAYREACQAFVDERIEAYNPIGLQYTIEPARRREAAKLEFQLDWFDSQAEFKLLLESVAAKAEAEITDVRLSELVNELIKQVGAFPDNSIIAGYQVKPTLNKLPDYIVAQAIEELVR